MQLLTAVLMNKALSSLDNQLSFSKYSKIDLIVGGGGAMILAHGFPLGTTDIDAIPKGIELAELDGFVKTVADELNLPKDWLNPYFSTYAHTLPSDYGDRLIEIFNGKSLKALALGKEEMLIMKCFAHRQKDVGHAKALIKGGANLGFVEDQIEKLQKKGIRGAQEAIEFLDDVSDQI